MKPEKETLDKAISRVVARRLSEEEEADREIKEALEAMKLPRPVAGLFPWEMTPEVM